MAAIELGNARVLAPGRWRPLRAIGWLLLLFVAVFAVLVLPAVAAHTQARPTQFPMALMLAGDLLAYLAYAGLVRWGEARRPAELAPTALPQDLLLGWLIGAGMFTLVFASLRLAGAYTLARTAGWPDAGHDVLFTLSTGLHEELIARLVIFRLVMRAAGAWPALIVSALLFGAAHLANPNASWVAAFAIAIEAGLMLAAFYLLTGRIWMSVGVHAAWNFMQGPFFGARVSGTTEQGSLFASAPVAGAPDWLSGGPFGPEASVPAMIVGLAVFLLVFAAARRRRNV